MVAHDGSGLEEVEFRLDLSLGVIAVFTYVSSTDVQPSISKTTAISAFRDGKSEAVQYDAVYQLRGTKTQALHPGQATPKSA